MTPCLAIQYRTVPPACGSETKNVFCMWEDPDSTPQISNFKYTLEVTSKISAGDSQTLLPSRLGQEREYQVLTLYYWTIVGNCRAMKLSLASVSHLLCLRLAYLKGCCTENVGKRRPILVASSSLWKKKYITNKETGCSPRELCVWRIHNPEWLQYRENKKCTNHTTQVFFLKGRKTTHFWITDNIILDEIISKTLSPSATKHKVSLKVDVSKKAISTPLPMYNKFMIYTVLTSA